MTTLQAMSLQKYDIVRHKQFGECIVVEPMIPDFGPVITPFTAKGLLQLVHLSGMPAGTPYLATDFKRNLTKMDITS